jgi:hypothetical protein
MSERQELEALRTEMQRIIPKYETLALWAEMEQIMKERREAEKNRKRDRAHLWFYLDAPTANQLHAACKQQGCKISAFLADAVRTKLSAINTAHP